MNFKPSFTVENTVDVFLEHCSFYSDTRGVTPVDVTKDWSKHFRKNSYRASTDIIINVSSAYYTIR
jgi:hypothetical protein